jgi:hypothetical protein
MSPKVLSIIEHLSDLAGAEKKAKISQSFYIPKALLERLKNALPPNVSASAAVSAMIAEYVNQAEALEARQERSLPRKSNKPEDEK